MLSDLQSSSSYQMLTGIYHTKDRYLRTLGGFESVRWRRRIKGRGKLEKRQEKPPPSKDEIKRGDFDKDIPSCQQGWYSNGSLGSKSTNTVKHDVVSFINSCHL